MILIACIDDDYGMMFNNRRQSRDRILTGRILEMTRGRRFFVSRYTAALFTGAEDSVTIVDEPFVQAGKGDFVFAEDLLPGAYEDGLEKIVLFRWNRRYPADRVFDIPMAEHGWKLAGTSEFKGSSHDKISEEEYVR